MENIETQNTQLTQPEIPEIPDNTKPTEKIPLYKTIIAWCALGLGFVFTHFAFNYVGGIWGGVFWLLFGVLGAVYAVKSRAEITKMHVAMFAIAEIFCFAPLFCASRFINFLAAVFSFVLFFYLAMAVSGAEPFGKRFVLDTLLAILVRPFERFAECVRCAFSVFKGKNKTRNVLYALAGITIAIPLTVVVVMLLASSDERFEKFIETVSTDIPGFSFLTVAEILFGIPIAMYLFGAFSSMEKRVESREFDPDKLRVFPTVITYFAVSPICVFYVAYIITQVMNIASALDQTLDYSAFARRGFFELCAIAVINLGVIAVMQMFSKRTRILKGYIVALGLLSLGVTATALVKMGMYINEYGMTLLRVYTTWFMLVMCIAFVLLIVLQFKDYKFWRVLFFGFTAMFAVLCFGNFNGNIAAYNIAAYQSGAIEELDVNQFDELGVAAVEPAYRLYSEDYEDDRLHNDLEGFIKDEYEKDRGVSRSAYFSIPRAKAWSAFDECHEMLKARPNPKELMRIVVEVDCNTAYGIEFEYLLSGEPMGSKGMQPADGSRLRRGEELIFTFFEEDFPNADLLSSETFAVCFEVIGKNDVNTPTDVPVLKWNAERGGEYSFVLRESNTDGFIISPVN